MARCGGLFVLLIGILSFMLSAILEAYSVFNRYQFYGQFDWSTIAVMIGVSFRSLLISLGLIFTGITLMALAADRRVNPGRQEPTSGEQ